MVHRISWTATKRCSLEYIFELNSWIFGNSLFCPSFFPILGSLSLFLWKILLHFLQASFFFSIGDYTVSKSEKGWRDLWRSSGPFPFLAGHPTAACSGPCPDKAGDSTTFLSNLCQGSVIVTVKKNIPWCSDGTGEKQGITCISCLQYWEAVKEKLK